MYEYFAYIIYMHNMHAMHAFLALIARNACASWPLEMLMLFDGRVAFSCTFLTEKSNFLRFCNGEVDLLVSVSSKANLFAPWTGDIKFSGFFDVKVSLCFVPRGRKVDCELLQAFVPHPSMPQSRPDGSSQGTSQKRDCQRFKRQRVFSSICAIVERE